MALYSFISYCTLTENESEKFCKDCELYGG